MYLSKGGMNELSCMNVRVLTPPAGAPAPAWPGTTRPAVGAAPPAWVGLGGAWLDEHASSSGVAASVAAPTASVFRSCRREREPGMLDHLLLKPRYGRW